ncbi:polysaccharide deacetylase family protein [uncultured Clostridium sp.]|uniref:polysaccharide deacetylase family protein n=1 Tax=uncultured Clostridium sp. TaxID=59620 RepID=UPI0025DEDEB4|nr:polysaccharide deacetylase family protein [uncultured Clostridium sp.]
MRHKSRRDKNSKMMYETKLIILCTSIVILVVVGSAVMAQRFFTYINTVQATDNQIVLNNSNNNNDSDNSKNNESNSENDESNAQNESDADINDIPSDSPQFIQKYLDQQMKGQMPEGADGVKAVYLTFDDGPSETVTPQILDILKNEGVHATFFVLGKAIDSSEENKELLKRTVSEGNAIGIHSYSHNYKILYPNNIVNVNNFKDEVEKTNASLKSVLGEDFTTKAIRFPGGHMTWKGTEALDDYFQQEGYSYIDWNALSKDAEGASKNAQQLYQEVINTTGTKQKVILLMHDTYKKEETAKSLPDIIHYFKDNGYEFRVIK